ncbi:MAG: PD-(D/E)XK nuclease family protein [Desulfovibrionaceae bacterium]
MLKKSKQIASFLQKCQEIETRQKKDNVLKPRTMELLSIYDKNHKELGNSNVIAYLLNTISVCNNKKEYLYLFLEHLKLPNIDLNIDLSKTEIYREKDNIDIYIKHDNFAIIIENKIYAGDQENQLQKYKNIVKNSSIPLENIYIIYLTLEGKEASEYSTNKDE